MILHLQEKSINYSKLDIDISNQKIAYFSEFINHKGLDSDLKDQF